MWQEERLPPPDARLLPGTTRAELERPPSADSIAARNYQNVFPDEEPKSDGLNFTANFGLPTFDTGSMRGEVRAKADALKDTLSAQKDALLDTFSWQRFAEARDQLADTLDGARDQLADTVAGVVDGIQDASAAAHGDDYHGAGVFTEDDLRPGGADLSPKPGPR